MCKQGDGIFQNGLSRVTGVMGMVVDNGNVGSCHGVLEVVMEGIDDDYVAEVAVMVSEWS